MNPSLLGVFCCAAWVFASGMAHTQAAETEAYILAKKDQPAIVGSKLTVETISDFKDSKYVVEVEDEKVEGKGSFKKEEIVVTECLSPSRYRQIQTKDETLHRAEIGDEMMDLPTQPGCLTGAAVILEKNEKDGSFTATLEKGDATQDQKERLVELGKEASRRDDLIMFGEQARKPGDKWDVDVTKLSSFADGKDLRGTMTVEFTEVKEIGGSRCAVLKCIFDITGSIRTGGMEDGKMAMKGEEISQRSLVDLVKLESKCTGKITMIGETEDGTVQSESLLTITTRCTVAKP